MTVHSAGWAAEQGGEGSASARRKRRKNRADRKMDFIIVLLP
jgi:hypothetical protein